MNKQIFDVTDETFLSQIANEVREAAEELVAAAHLTAGQTVVVGCSSSEVMGDNLGSHSAPRVGKAVFDALMAVFSPRGIYLAAQCCEHLNRALIIEKDAVPMTDIVNVVPVPKAGGSFATAAYHGFSSPVAVEHIRADAGLDIGGTLIGMHLKEVAVPVRLGRCHIGEALLLAARVRPKFIGGERAEYDEGLKNGYPD